ncbi:hypothetical protein B0H19DRAFT_1256009 [Mycena capillaripes]|nr:hypothetical protein B0H19DRAFT_1256009 [Mycena capillaripes]
MFKIIQVLSRRIGRCKQTFKRPFLEPWTDSACERYVIDRAHWNTEGPVDPANSLHFSVEWDLFSAMYLLRPNAYGVEIGSLIVRCYYGIIGCIIPVGCVLGAQGDMFGFMLAGPPDAKGRKEFYVLHHEPENLDRTWLSRFSPGFVSVSEFHRNVAYGRSPKQRAQEVLPVPGGGSTLGTVVSMWLPREAE